MKTPFTLPECQIKVCGEIYAASNQQKAEELNAVDELFAKVARLKLNLPVPDSIEVSERPDFILRFSTTKTGLEVTASVRQEDARAMDMQKREFPDHFILRPDLSSQRRPKDQLRELATTDEPPADCVEDVLQDWQCRVSARHKAKTEKLNEMGFQVFSENWLLIDEPWPLPPYQRVVDFAQSTFPRLLGQKHGMPKGFNVVLIHSGRLLFRWENGKLNSYGP
jgi:hypothetical protein